MRRLLLIFLILSGLVPLLTACTQNRTVLVFGDSFTAESRRELSAALEPQFKLGVNAFSGSASCDWAENIRKQATTHHPALVVIQFSGNAFSQCMSAFQASAALVATKYRWDATLLSNMLTALKIPHLFVGPPPAQPGMTRPDQDPVYASIATLTPAWAHAVNAGSALGNATGEWTSSLPCAPQEGVEQGCRDGGIVVRSDDGYHFCPVAKDLTLPWGTPCPVYSSGATRYVAMIATAVRAILPGIVPPTKSKVPTTFPRTVPTK